MMPPSDERTQSQSSLQQNTTPQQSIPATSREPALHPVHPQERFHDRPQQIRRAIRPKHQSPSLDLLWNLLPAKLLRSIRDRVARTNAEANQVNSSEKPQRSERVERNQNEDREAVPNYRPSQFRCDNPDSSTKGHAPSTPAQREILPERPVNRVLFTEDDSDEDKPAHIPNNHALRGNSPPQTLEHVRRDALTREDEREVHIKVEPELIVIENNDSHDQSDKETSPQAGNEDTVEPSPSNGAEPLSVEGVQGATGDGEVQNVSGTQTRQPQHTRRRRGTKRRLSEVETGYWLRSRKPPSSSKRSKRTTYWLRPKREPRTI